MRLIVSLLFLAMGYCLAYEAPSHKIHTMAPTQHVKLCLLSLAAGYCLAYSSSADYGTPEVSPAVLEPVEVPKPYNHGYNVDDGYNNRHHHHEDSDALGTKRGSYGYTGANGLYRTVNYVADDQGFRAQIVSNEPGLGAEGSADVGMRVNPVPASIKAEMELLRLPMKPVSIPQMGVQSVAMEPSYQPKMQVMNVMAQPAVTEMKPMAFNQPPAIPHFRPTVSVPKMEMHPVAVEPSYQPKMQVMNVMSQPVVQEMSVPQLPRVRPMASALQLPAVPDVRPMIHVPQVMNPATMVPSRAARRPSYSAQSFEPRRRLRVRLPLAMTTPPTFNAY